MKICVKQRHIDAGVRYSSGCCPVARAISDIFVFTPTDRISVCCETLLVGDSQFDLPGKVRDWTAMFDSGRPVQPFEFELEI